MLSLVVADRRWTGKRCIVAASGPSLTKAVAAVCDGEIVLAVNDAYKIFPKAEILYACDTSWWAVNKFVLEFPGERWTSHSEAPKNIKSNMPHQDLFNIIAGKIGTGFSTNPEFIHYGNNSGFQAVNLAILFGATEIVLVGFDMRIVGNQSHFFGNHKSPLTDSHSFVIWVQEFANASKQLDALGVRIINATPGSALRCFPMMPLEEALNPIIEVAAE